MTTKKGAARYYPVFFIFGGIVYAFTLLSAMAVTGRGHKNLICSLLLFRKLSRWFGNEDRTRTTFLILCKTKSFFWPSPTSS